MYAQILVHAESMVSRNVVNRVPTVMPLSMILIMWIHTALVIILVAKAMSPLVVWMLPKYAVGFVIV